MFSFDIGTSGGIYIEAQRLVNEIHDCNVAFCLACTSIVAYAELVKMRVGVRLNTAIIKATGTIEFLT